MDDIAQRTAAHIHPTRIVPDHCAFHGVLVALCFGLLPTLAAAQPRYPNIVGSGEDRTIDYGPGPHGNVVGGGHVVVDGGGEDTTFTALGPRPVQPPRVGMMPVVVAGGEHATTVWLPADTDRLWQALVGGDGSLPEVASSGTSVQSASRTAKPRI